jgi:hypothetical protein
MSRPDEFDRLLDRAKTTGQPVSIEALVLTWAKKNRNHLVNVAFRMMREDAGTTYVIPPLRFTAFGTDTARQTYHNSLVAELEREGEAVTFEHIAFRHVEKVILWCRRELENQLDGLATKATYGSSVTVVPMVGRGHA